MADRKKKKASRKRETLPGGEVRYTEPLQPYGPRDRTGVDWWLAENSDDAAAAAVACVMFWRDNQRWRISKYLRQARLYGNLPQGMAAGSDLSRYNLLQEHLRGVFTENVIKECVDTIASKVASERPKPYFLSSAGNYKAIRKCRSLNRFMAGVFDEIGFYETYSRNVTDALIWGEGWFHPYEKDGRVAAERIPLDEIWFDTVEAMSSTRGPSQLHRVKVMDRAVAMREFPDKASMLREAGCAMATENLGQNTLMDPVAIGECWTPKTSAGPGQHLVYCDQGAIKELEDYDYPDYPFERLPFSLMPFGWMASGMVEMLEPSQEEIDTLYGGIQEAMWLAGHFKWFVEDGAALDANHIDNVTGTVLTGKKPPVNLLASVVQPEIYAWIRNVADRMFAMSGVNQLDAGGQIPANLKSGEAQRVYEDIGTKRFSVFAKAAEQYVLGASDKILRVVQTIVARDGKYAAKSVNRDTVEEIDWQDLKYKPDVFTIRCYPISSLPSDPAGRLEKIDEMSQRGWLDPDTARNLMDFPDIDREESLWRQQFDRIAKSLDAIIDDDVLEPPDVYDNLVMAHTMALRALKWAQNHDVEDSKQLSLQQYIEEVVKLKARAAQQSAPPPGQMPGAAAAPMMPPNSPAPEQGA